MAHANTALVMHTCPHWLLELPCAQTAALEAARAALQNTRERAPSRPSFTFTSGRSDVGRSAAAEAASQEATRAVLGQALDGMASTDVDWQVQALLLAGGQHLLACTRCSVWWPAGGPCRPSACAERPGRPAGVDGQHAQRRWCVLCGACQKSCSAPVVHSERRRAGPDPAWGPQPALKQQPASASQLELEFAEPASSFFDFVSQVRGVPVAGC